MHSKPSLIASIIITSLAILLFAVFFVCCINAYFSFDIEYSDLTYEELTFEKHEMIFGRIDRYEIYVKEYSKPLVISSITERAVQRGNLLKLKENDKVQIYYCEPYDEIYQYETCEIKSGSTVILSLSDYIEVNQRNQMIGMIMFPIIVLLCLFLLIVFIFLYKKLKEFGNAESDLGLVKIEYRADGNIIQVYNSPDVCSLVINGEITDKYLGFVATPFILNGEIESDGNKIPIKAKMGLLNMRLYYNGEVVAKKFMGLG